MADQQDHTPREDQVATQPATPELCAEDFADGARQRAEMEKQWELERAKHSGAR